jgi:hypothetical protein
MPGSSSLQRAPASSRERESISRARELERKTKDPYELVHDRLENILGGVWTCQAFLILDIRY